MRAPFRTGGSGNPTNDTTVSSLFVGDLPAEAACCLTFWLCLEHERDGDLLITLNTPDANTVVLANHRGGTGSNFTYTAFRDDAASNIADGTSPFTGEFRPDWPIALALGKPPDAGVHLGTSAFAKATAGQGERASSCFSA